MSFTQDDVNKLAHLARISLSDNSSERRSSEVNSFAHSIVEDLGNILQLVDQICQINTKDISPVAHAQQLVLRTRPDEVTEPDVRARMQQLVAKDATAVGLYLVPKVVE